jgi:hypothetical protein
LVMLTKNIDLKVGVANGTAKIITKLEFNWKESTYVALNPSKYMQMVQK